MTMPEPKTTVLYARVSREEQVRGYSLAQQLEALREHCAREGHEVVAEVEDPAESSATLIRPGLDRVRDLLEEGAAVLALAQDADRITREPMHRFILDEEAGRRGARWAALDDWGDDSHEGELLKFLKGWVSKGERLKIAERTRRGSLRKVREGKLIKARRPNYGFRYVGAKGDSYEVVEDRMVVVRRVFEEVAAGGSLRAVCRTLKDEGIPSPAGDPGSWSSTQIRRIVEAEVYRPHTLDELRELGVREEVLAGLDSRTHHGVWFYNRRDVESERVRENGTYKKTSRWTYRDPKDWIGVPVPDAGVPSETVERARTAVESNVRTSRAAGREWELSGGVARCASCGSTMRTRTRSRDNGGEPLAYYVCSRAHQGGGCGATRNHRAGALEAEVVGLVDGELLCDRETLERWMDAGPGSAGEGRSRRDPGATERALASALGEVAAERERLVRLYTTGRLGDAEYDAHAAELDDREASARAELERARGEAERAGALQENRRAVLEAFGAGLQLGLFYFPPALRRQVYGALGLAVVVFPDGSVEIEGHFDAEAIRLTREVEEHALALREVEGRANATPVRGAAEGWERLEHELIRVRNEQTPRPSPRAGPV